MDEAETKLLRRIEDNERIWDNLSESDRLWIIQIFNDDLSNQAIKAIQANSHRPQYYGGSIEHQDFFQGTSFSTHITPITYQEPIFPKSLEELASIFATAYINESEKHEKATIQAFGEPSEKWLEEGMYWAIHLSHKIVSQATGYMIDAKDLTVDDFIPCACQAGAEINMGKVLETINKRGVLPEKVKSIDELRLMIKLLDRTSNNQFAVAPPNSNEIAYGFSGLMTEAVNEEISIRKKQGTYSGRLEKIPGIQVIIGDTDSPHSVYKFRGLSPKYGAPFTPGLTILGATGPIEITREDNVNTSFPIQQIYRLGLIAQNESKNSTRSASKSHIPAVMYTGLPRSESCGLYFREGIGLRYPGMFDPGIEFMNELTKYTPFLENKGSSTSNKLRSLLLNLNN